MDAAADFNILIVEDDLLIAEMLMEMLSELGYQPCGIAKNYDQAVALLTNHRAIDLCFIDINLQDKKDGFDVVEVINRELRIPFIFLTSYADRLTINKAVALNPEAYLVKPFSSTDLLTTIEIVRKRRQVTQDSGERAKSILIKDAHLTVRLKTSDIRWIKSDNIYLEIKTPGKTYLVRNSMEKFLEELGDPSVFRTHRSFAVNLSYVNAVNGQYLVVDAEKIPISRKYREAIHARFLSPPERRVSNSHKN